MSSNDDLKEIEGQDGRRAQEAPEEERDGRRRGIPVPQAELRNENATIAGRRVI